MRVSTGSRPIMFCPPPLLSWQTTRIKWLRRSGRAGHGTVWPADRISVRGGDRSVARTDGLAEAIPDSGELGIHEFVCVFKTLIKVAIQHHLRQGGDSWVIAVNPRHRRFYQKVLGFVPLGPRRTYSSVQGHPAEAYVSGVDLLRVHAPGMSREVLGEILPSRSVLERPRGRPLGFATSASGPLKPIARRSMPSYRT